MKKYLDFALRMCKHAKKVMLKYYKHKNGENYKTDHTIVTKADTEINNYLIEQVKKNFPSHSVNGEENSFGNSKFVWVCDPVDGTAMYVKHLPVAVFSIALCEDGAPILGAVMDPFSNKVYYAVKGQGAFVNGHKLSVNNLGFEQMKTIGHVDIWPFSGYKILDVIKQLENKSYIVSIGTVTHACMMVASGDFSYIIFPGTVGKNVDFAAAKIIIEEAGGKVTDFDGNEQRYDKDINGAIASNGVLQSELIKLVKKYAIKK